MFQLLKIQNWRQFSNITFKFHPRLTVITGANGAGKSTVLRILSQHFGYPYTLLATPTVTKTGVLRYLAGFFGISKRMDLSEQNEVGSLEYQDGQRTSLIIPEQGSVSYIIHFSSMQQTDGLFIASHRPTSGYQQVSSIPTNALTAEQAYQLYNQEVQKRYSNEYTQYSPTYRIKEAIISMATFGPGNEHVQENSELRATFDEFTRVLQKVLPESIGFRSISVRIPDVVLVTDTGEFLLDAASGGLMALIDLAWQIFLYSRGRRSFVAVIDEPENHLHPTMQRTIMGSLLNAFPNVQFIVASHSPFVVSSVKDSAVYVLRYSEGEDASSKQSRVYSEALDTVNKAATATEILRSVLGVPVTLPMWAENELEAIADGFGANTLDSTAIRELRRRLEDAGLGEFYPAALAQIAARQ